MKKELLKKKYYLYLKTKGMQGDNLKVKLIMPHD